MARHLIKMSRNTRSGSKKGRGDAAKDPASSRNEPSISGTPQPQEDPAPAPAPAAKRPRKPMAKKLAELAAVEQAGPSASVEA